MKKRIKYLDHDDVVITTRETVFTFNIFYQQCEGCALVFWNADNSFLRKYYSDYARITEYRGFTVDRVSTVNSQLSFLVDSINEFCPESSLDSASSALKIGGGDGAFISKVIEFFDLREGILIEPSHSAKRALEKGGFHVEGGLPIV
jgi:hypothetical protein